MIKTISKAIYSAFISIFLLSIILAVWTGYVFVSKPSKSSEIVYFIKDIYESQKTVIIDFVDLSQLLLKNNSETKNNETNDLLQEAELVTDLKGKSNLDESSIFEDNGDNPLGIVIEPSFSEIKEERLPDISEESSLEKQSEISMNDMKMNMK